MMDRQSLEYGVVKYKTPFYVFDLDEMKENVQRFRTVFEGKAGLCYAMKANPFLISRMEEEIDRIEVCSMGEFRICKERSVKPEKLLISGVLKKKEDLLEILETYGGKCRYTVESLQQLQILAEWSERKREVISVYLRLTSGNQFGMDEKTVRERIRLRHVYPYIYFCGIHFFSGTQKKKIEKMKEELDYLDSFCRELEEETGIVLAELEYGPGLSVSYFEKQKDMEEQDLQQIASYISDMRWKGKVTLEMGRAFAASCGYYLTSVQDIKKNKGKNYCIVDGGIHQMNYDGQIRGMYQPMMQIIPDPTEGQEEKWTVCGALCTGNDVLIQNAELKGVQIGTVFVFERAGAYSMTEGMSLFLSHALPKIFFYSREDGWKVVREKQSTYHMNMEV